MRTGLRSPLQPSASADGTQLFISSPGSIGISPDWGKTWTGISAPSSSLEGPIAVSADGSQLIMAPINRNPINVLSRTPKPMLNLRRVGDSITVAWTVPSKRLVLQQTSDLTMLNWSDVEYSPSLNLSNLQFETTVASPQPAFYRLISK